MGGAHKRDMRKATLGFVWQCNSVIQRRSKYNVYFAMQFYAALG